MSLGNVAYDIKSPIKVDGYVELKNMSSTPTTSDSGAKLYIREDELYLLPRDGVEKKVGADDKSTALLREQILRQQLSIIKIQFKYDMALNFTRNNCGDYLIDTLENNEGVKGVFNCSYESASQTIK